MSIKKLLPAGLLIALFFLNCSYITAQTTPDPGLPGSFAVSTTSYNLGDLAFSDPSFPNPMEVCGSVFYPTSLSSGPFPVLMFMHGRHETTYETANPANTNSNWPPAAGYQSITSYQGYDYIANQMASHGYIVISISTNAINAADAGVADYGMSARAALMQHHLDLWNTWNTIGGTPFGTMFVGKLDMNNIGTMGHSRGGEGVVANALLNRSLGSPYGIKAVLTLAPVDFAREVLNGIPMLNVAPYCDGDVSDLQGVHYYDDARYSDLTDQTEKYSVLVMGANHNFFNTVWTPGLYPAGGIDDWDGYVGSSDIHCGTAGSASTRLTPARQQAVFNAYASAFFRLHIGNETAFAPILQVDDIIPPTSSTADSSEIFVSYHPPYSKRLDINRELTESAEITNTLSATVTGTGFAKYDICSDDTGEITCSVSIFHDKEPHSGKSGILGMPQLGMRWSGATNSYVNDLPPANQNVSIYQNLQFRTTIDYSEYSSGPPLNFSVQLIDVLGNTGSVQVSDFTNVLFYPPGAEFGELPKDMFNTVKIPLTAFTGVDLMQIQKVKFLFDKSPAGSIYITELSLTGLTPLTTSVGTTSAGNIFIYPNPADHNINIDLGKDHKDITSITVYDIQGKLIYKMENVSQELVTIDLSNFEKGLYILNVAGTTDSKNYKIVKQ